MKEIVSEEVEELEPYDENEHLNQMWRPLEIHIDANYPYIQKGKLFEMASNMLYYGVAVPVLHILTKIVYDFKIEGRENLKEIENTGAVSVSNHVLILDCAMVRTCIR